MAEVIVNKLLCCVRNNFSKHPKELVGVQYWVWFFYRDEEINL